jgi:integrase
VVGSNDRRRRRSFASESLALAYLKRFATKTDTRTVSAAVDEYIQYLRGRGLRDGSVATVAFRLRALLRTTDRERSLRTITPAIARDLYARRCAEIAPETQRQELQVASAFACWTVKQGWLRADPFASIEATRARARRKPQHRIDEARKFLELALGEGSRSGLAAAIALTMGLRASEVVDRTVRDVDDGARVLWIDHSKSKAGERTLEVPEVLRAPLADLVAGRDGGERLFGDVDRHWVYYHVRRLSKKAGVPVVTPHGLRGTWSSIAAEVTPVDHVARALGHANTAVTRRHYLAAGAERAGQQERALRVLQGGRP